MAISTSSDPIFGPPKKSRGWVWWFVLLGFVGLVWFLWSRPQPDERIETNQVLALETVKDLLKVYKKWKRNDYDGNGRQDLPLGHLRVLRETQFINGRAIELVEESLVQADMREASPIALNGYLFTVTHPDLEWPSEQMVLELSILAKPIEPGVSGSCSFYVNTTGEAWYTNVALEQEVPPWPNQRSIDAGVWTSLEL